MNKTFLCFWADVIIIGGNLPDSGDGVVLVAAEHYRVGLQHLRGDVADSVGKLQDDAVVAYAVLFVEIPDREPVACRSYGRRRIIASSNNSKIYKNYRCILEFCLNPFVVAFPIGNN